MDVSGAIRAYLISNCHYDDSWHHILLAFILFVPTALTFVFFGVSYYTKQVFWLIMSFALAIDWGFNTLISGWAQEAAPVPTCGGPRAFPSFMMEHSAFMYNYLMISDHFFALNLTWWDVTWLQVWILLTWIASIELGYNNFRQALVGNLIGQVLSFLAVGLIRTFIYPFRRYMLRTGLLHFIGYRDTIFANDDLTLAFTQTDMQHLKNVVMSTEYDQNNNETLWRLMLANFSHNIKKS
jgi:hypothetical protein